MDPLFYFFVFILGAIVGSFLNVVILRFGTGITIMGRSFCFSCRKQLTWRDLFPVLSFLTLGGKCRFCKSKISKQYVAVETLTGIIFALIFWKLGGLVGFTEAFSSGGASVVYFLGILFYFIAFSLLIIMAVYDAKHKIIPDVFSYSFAGLAFVKMIAFLPVSVMSVPLELFAGPTLALPLFLLWYFSKGRWIGLGDSKLMLGVGWFLGIQDGFSSIILAFWIGAAVGLFLVVFEKIRTSSWFHRKVTIKSELPFAPFIILGFCLATFLPALAQAVWQLFFPAI